MSMLLELRIKNCFVFYKEVIFSMEADMRNKKLGFNVVALNNFNIVKTAGIYGANNSGKTCLIRCIKEFRNILLNQNADISNNIFHNDNVISLGATFTCRGKVYSYDISYDIVSKQYIYEAFYEIEKDSYGNVKKQVILLKDDANKQYELNLGNSDSTFLFNVIGRNNLLVYLVNIEQFESLKTVKECIVDFASCIDVIDMNSINSDHTIALLKGRDQGKTKNLVRFIKQADLFLDGVEYESDINNIPNLEGSRLLQDITKSDNANKERLKLVSDYHGRKVPSLIYDSVGTQKIIAVASYILDALDSGRIVVIDELDSSLHFKLTRAIVALFNNELNDSAQLIFSVHDVSLLDVKRLMRKDQIWFVHKDENGTYLYSLAEFTAKDFGVRDTSDIYEKYKSGIFGALPEPDLINALIDLRTEGKELWDCK